jgi:hypothetical protein
MEAKDVGDSISIYLPYGQAGREPFAVFQERSPMGTFGTRDESLRFAFGLAERLHRERRVPVRMRVEDEMGAWETRDGLAGSAT